MTHSSASCIHTVSPRTVSTTEPPAISQVDMEALRWQVVLWSGEATAAEQRAFGHWLAANPRHGEAWQRVQGLGREIAAVPGAIAGPVLRAGLPMCGGNARRNVLRGMCLLAGCGISACLIRETGQWP